MKIPKVTLFALMSVDGKISTGPYIENDFDLDLPKIPAVRDGLHQYYDLQSETDEFFLVTGKTMQKLGYNSGDIEDKYVDATCVLLDNNHMTENGIKNLCKMHRRVILFSQNEQFFHLTMQLSNFYLHTSPQISMRYVLNTLANSYGCEALTLQSGGTVTYAFLKERLIHEVYLVVVPILVGGKETPTLVDGDLYYSESLALSRIGTLQLKNVRQLKNSYVQMQYVVLNSAPD